MLIDRLWPRGVSKERAKLDEWAKELAPSTELREWFRHDPGRFAEFRRRYVDELRGERTRLAALRRRARESTLTLVYSAHDEEHNGAVVLAAVLRRGLPRQKERRRSPPAATIERQGASDSPENRDPRAREEQP